MFVCLINANFRSIVLEKVISPSANDFFAEKNYFVVIPNIEKCLI